VRKPFPTAEKEEIVQIQIEGNPKSIAIGRATQGHEHWNALTTREGVCVEVIHFFGDCLWEKNGAQFPPGFKRDQVERIAEQPIEVRENLPPTEGDEIASGGESESEGEEKNDDLLYKCLLMALRHTKDKELPMGINEVYQRMRKCRPPNSSIDVKKTSWKKLLPFLRSCEESGLCSMSKDGEKLLRIRRDDENLSSFEPWELADEAEVDFSSRCLLVETVWVVPERLRTLWEKQVITAEECDEGIRLYANSKDLWMANNRKRIGPDSLLQHEGVVSVVGEKMRENMQASHRVSETFGGETKVKIRPGHPPKVQVRTATRRGHNVTLVSGLHNYAVDLKLLCDQLKKRFAASTAVEDKDIMMQGLWNNSVEKLLVEEWNLPLDAVNNQAKLKEKKIKQATNIVKH